MDRKCTDPLVCILFLAWIIIMIAISAFSINTGKVEQLTFKYDMQGLECTTNKDGYTKKLFTRLIPRTTPLIMDTSEYSKVGLDYKHYSVCVKECPTKGKKVDFLPNDFYDKGSKELSTWDYEVDELMGFCFPKMELLEKILKNILEMMTEKMGSFARYLHDIVIGWPIIVVMSVGSLFVTIIYMYLLKWITKPVLFSSLFFFFLWGSLITGWCFLNARKYPEGSTDRKYTYGFGIASGILTTLYTVFICCNCTNIRVGAEIMGVAGEFVASTPRIMFVSFFAYFLMLPIVVWFTFTNVFLYSTGTPTFEKGEMFAQLEETKEAYWMFWIFLFGFFWIIAFMIAVLQFVTAAICAQWYFTCQQSDADTTVSVQRGVIWALKYHAGSLAFGSMLIAIV